MSIPRNHHYVSQVLIRKFLNNENTLHYYKKSNSVFGKTQSTKNTFSERDLNSTINGNGQIDHITIEENLDKNFEKDFNANYNLIEFYVSSGVVSGNELKANVVEAIKNLIPMGLIGEMRTPQRMEQTYEGIFGVLRMIASNATDKLKQEIEGYEQRVAGVKNKLPINFSEVCSKVTDLMGDTIYSIFITPPSEFFILSDCTSAILRANLLDDVIHNGERLVSEGMSIASVMYPINSNIIISATSTKISKKRPNEIFVLKKSEVYDFNKAFFERANEKVICTDEKYLKNFVTTYLEKAERDNYNKIFDNGIAHVNSAKSLAENNSFGFAISHLILGMEELIKYQVYMNYNIDNTLFDKEANPQNRKTIFKDHITKHGLIKEFQESLSKDFSEKFIESVFYMSTGQELKPEHIEVQQNRFKATGNFLSNCYEEINIPENERQDFFDWLGKANDFKNRGFYVNVNNGVCESPAAIEKEEFAIALKYVEAILKQTEVIKSMDVTDDELIDFLNSDINANAKEGSPAPLHL